MKLRTGLWHGRTLLLAAAGVFWMLGCGGDGGSNAVVDPAPDNTYPVQVISAGANASSGGNCLPGAIVSVYAGTAPSGYVFYNWTTESRGVTFDNANSPNAWFTMPANAVTVRANFALAEIPGHVHTWGGWVVTTPATCESAGVETRICAEDASHKENRPIAMLTGAGCGGGGGGGVEFVTIGGRKWMKKNLNVQTADSWCYGEGGPVYDAGHDGEMITSSEAQANCAKYGRLYTWSAARTACSLVGTGWRLPSRADWDSLARAVGGTKAYSSESSDHDWYDAGRNLKSTSGWNDYDGASGNGTDAYGFTALPGGRRYSDGSFYGAGNYGYWWTATETGGGLAYDRSMDYYGVSVNEDYDVVSYGFSVRCVGD